MIVGVPSRGQSTTSSQLTVRLFPAPNQLRLGIEAAGVVDSQTSSTAGPVTFMSHGESSYRVGKLIVINGEGIRVGRAMADVNNQTRLSGLETDFDGIPLLRNFVRSYALSQHGEKQGQARQEVEVKVASRAEQRLDAEVNARLLKAESEFRDRFVAPLARLGLDRTVIQLATSQDRLTARLRLGRHDQLGAHTPRPLALSNSLASVQIHESAINNLLDRFELAGRTFTLPELYQRISNPLGRMPVKVPDDLPENVVVTFAEEDPVRVRCHRGPRRGATGHRRARSRGAGLVRFRHHGLFPTSVRRPALGIRPRWLDRAGRRRARGSHGDRAAGHFRQGLFAAQKTASQRRKSAPIAPRWRLWNSPAPW